MQINTDRLGATAEWVGERGWDINRIHSVLMRQYFTPPCSANFTIRVVVSRRKENEQMSFGTFEYIFLYIYI